MLPWILDKSFSVRGGNNFTSRAHGQSCYLSHPFLYRCAALVLLQEPPHGRVHPTPGKKLTDVEPPSPLSLSLSLCYLLDFLDLSCFSVDKTRCDATWHLTYMEKSRLVTTQWWNFSLLPSRPIKRRRYSPESGSIWTGAWLEQNKKEESFEHSLL